MKYVKVTRVAKWLAKEKNFANHIIVAIYVRETEKAISIKPINSNGATFNDVWLPKSQIDYEMITKDELESVYEKVHGYTIIEAREVNNMKIFQEQEDKREKDRQLATSKITSEQWETIVFVAKKINAEVEVVGVSQYNKSVVSLKCKDCDWWIVAYDLIELHLLKSYLTNALDKPIDEARKSLDYFMHNSDRGKLVRGKYPIENVEFD